MSRYVVKPARPESAGADERLADAEPLEGTDLLITDAQDPGELLARKDIEWVAPTVGDDGDESYPTGEVSIRFASALDADDLDAFVDRHDLELRRRNEFVPEQIVVAPTRPRHTWLPDVVERLNDESVVAKAWPNTLSQYRRG